MQSQLAIQSDPVSYLRCRWPEACEHSYAISGEAIRLQHLVIHLTMDLPAIASTRIVVGHLQRTGLHS